MIYIGIDPGVTGAIAMIYGDTREVVIHPMPIQAKRSGNKNEIAAAQLFALLPANPGGSMVAIEQVASRPGQGVAAMFSLGDSFGVVRACIAIYGAQYITITPQSWKKFAEIPPKSAKEYSVTRALQLYPEVRPIINRKSDHGKADALLIAHFAYMNGTHRAALGKKVKSVNPRARLRELAVGESER